MIGGPAPIFIMTFYKKVSNPAFRGWVGETKETAMVNFPPIPVYLDENLTGVFIDSTSKSIDIKTTTTLDGEGGGNDKEDQEAVGSTVTLNMVSRKDSVAGTLLLALIDQAFTKLASGEYSITLLYGAMTLFFSKISGLSVSESADSNKREITLTLTKGTGKTGLAKVANILERSAGANPT
jgi:hypothetical protein